MADGAAPSSDDIDFINHPDLRVRDLSYSASRTRQLVDLFKGSFFDRGYGPQPEDAVRVATGDEWPNDRLETYIKEHARGPGYVCDVVYNSDELPFTVYAVLINRGHGLEVAELELFRREWGCFDPHDNYLNPDEQCPPDPNHPPTLITSDALRRIPIGDILARVQRNLPDDSWQRDGIRQVPDDSALAPDELNEQQRQSLRRASNSPRRRRGRPALGDDLLIQVVRAYIDESTRGRGAIRRLAETFERPEPTVREWISTARKRGYLAPTVSGRRSAAPGPNLPREPTLADVKPDLSRQRKRTVLRLLEAERILDANLPDSSLLVYVVSCLVCNEVGAAKMDNVKAAMENPAVLETAIDILDRARRRQAANGATSTVPSSADAGGDPLPPNPLFKS